MATPVDGGLTSRLRGVMVPLITPFDESYGIDWPAFDEHVSRMLAAGIRVLIPADLVGEAWALTFEEKVRLIERTVRLAAGKAVIVAKLSEPALPGLTELARAARSVAADAVKLALPPSGREDELPDEYVQQAVQAAGLPFLIETSGPEMPMAVLGRLARDPRFAGFEETSLDLGRFDDLVARFGGRAPVIAGSEDVLGFTLLLGAAGFMTATPNFAPAFMNALWDAGAALDAATTLRLYRRLRRYRELFWAELRTGRPMFVPYTKAALGLLGYRAGPPRPPLRPLAGRERDELLAILREELALEPSGGGVTC